MSDPPLVLVTNAQQDLHPDTEALARLAAEVLAAEGWGASAEVSLHFVDEVEMARLNEFHMGGTGPTDVLSFPIDGEGGPIQGPGEEPVLLGDVVLCPAVAEKAAPTHAGSPADELALLVVHGLLHLLGMDHVQEQQRLAMQTSERRHLDRSWGQLAGDPWSGS